MSKEMQPHDLGTTRIDRDLANLLQGDHPITGDHMHKVIQLEELIILYDATIAAGWARHTGDWDWFVTITADGIEYPQPQPGGSDIAYGMSFNFLRRPTDNFTACVDYDKVTHVELFYDDGTPKDLINLPIDSITNVNWEQA